MKCSICGKEPSLRIVGPKGFCKTHVKDAFELKKRLPPNPAQSDKIFDYQSFKQTDAFDVEY